SAAVPATLASVAATGSGSVTPATFIDGAATDLSRSYFVTLDAAGRLWTTNCLNLVGGSGPVLAFNANATGDVAPLVSIAGPNTGLSGCQNGVAVDAAGNLYVADITNNPPLYPGGQVAVFAPGAQGNVAPARVIAGPAANLHSPTGLWLDGAANVYVADSALGYAGINPDVQVFAAGSAGNVASMRTISGSNTNLAQPEGIVVDGAGFLYVANDTSDSITVYGPGASGNVAPVRTIAGTLTQLDVPQGLAVDAAGYLYVGNSDVNKNAPILVFAPGANGNVPPVQTITINTPSYAAPAGVAVH
ncbi:MAG: hypothetical protein JO359_01165, partial [Candidatus Eremiobacteraeota bacterium]|nr:hypothetical protein [Candidatus Eremiobacteraeota bacterium]